jgi:hypothetical protein
MREEEGWSFGGMTRVVVFFGPPTSSFSPFPLSRRPSSTPSTRACWRCEG